MKRNMGAGWGVGVEGSGTSGDVVEKMVWRRTYAPHRYTRKQLMGMRGGGGGGWGRGGGQGLYEGGGGIEECVCKVHSVCVCVRACACACVPDGNMRMHVYPSARLCVCRGVHIFKALTNNCVTSMFPPP